MCYYSPMKKIHIISKTHLDLGFTDYAKNVLDKYRNDFIPAAINLASALNKGKKKFIWTTGCYLIKDSLNNASIKNQKLLDDAIKRGDITWHALPFTTHSELLDMDTLKYGLSISKELDKKYNKKTVSAKMTDVPGHTIALLPYLYEAGIRFLHLGVNEASAMPKTPKEFLWKSGDAEIVVVYEGNYGGVYQNEYIDDILCFLHSNDNHGPSSKEDVEKLYQELALSYPDYEIAPSSLDEYAKAFIQVKDKLPIIESEIGDSWIHGVASDPYKTAALRELFTLKDKWLKEGTLKVNTSPYLKFCDNLLLITEHTWGMDIKRYFGDYDNYLKSDFKRARDNDFVKTKFRDIHKNIYQRVFSAYQRLKGEYKKGSYKAIEKSWVEQRAYIDKAISYLSKEMQNDARAALKKLKPTSGFTLDATYERANIDADYKLGCFDITLNENGIKMLKKQGALILDNKNDYATLSYKSYSCKDYDFWKSNYTRNYATTKNWSEPDFLMPGLKHYSDKYPQGRFSYTVKELFYSKDKESLVLELSTDATVITECGAPKVMQLKLSPQGDDLLVEVIWLGKEANRLPEALFINLPLNAKEESLKYVKIGKTINPYDVIENGNRNLSAVEKVLFECDDVQFQIENKHSPLVSIGQGKILEFDNKIESICEQGISFNLHNNIWGTNFPLWYEDNAYFAFILK